MVSKECVATHCDRWLRVYSLAGIDVGPGEEEGTFVFDLVESDTEIKDTINILVSGMASIERFSLVTRNIFRHIRISFLSQFLWVFPQWRINATNS